MNEWTYVRTDEWTDVWDKWIGGWDGMNEWMGRTDGDESDGRMDGWDE